MQNRLLSLLPNYFMPFDASFPSTDWLWPMEEALVDEFKIPAEYICPITLEVMKDPVFTCDGHTYERSAIQRYFETKLFSPITNKPLDTDRLVSNHAMRSAIQEMLSKQANPKNQKSVLLQKIIKELDSQLNQVNNPYERAQCIIKRGIAYYRLGSSRDGGEQFNQALCLLDEILEDFAQHAPISDESLFREYECKHLFCSVNYARN